MSTVPDDNRPGSGDPASADPDSHTGPSEWLEWAKQAATTGGDFFKLMFAELGLAISDAKRIAVLGLAMLPLGLLAWIGVSVLLAWLAYVPSESVALGIVVFIAVQVVPILVMLGMIKKYSKSLSLPATSRQIQAFKEGYQNGEKTEGSATEDSGSGRSSEDGAQPGKA